MARSEFNADKRADEREKSPVTIGGEKFFPRRMTNPVVKTVQKLGRSITELRESLGEESEDFQDKATDAMVQQIAELLRDKDGHPPALEHLSEHLDQRDATALLSWLMEDEQGNSSTPATEPTPATTAG